MSALPVSPPRPEVAKQEDLSTRRARKLTGSHNVLVFSLWPTTVVFHRYPDESPSPVERLDDGSIVHRTACGRIYWHYSGGDGSRTIRAATWLPSLHALRIGRPCGKCYPNGLAE